MAFWSESGWRGTRAAGVLNFLLAGNPEMTYADCLAWAAANGLPNWTPSTDPTDQDQYNYQVGLNGKIQWDENFPYPTNWSAIFKEWQAGTWIVPVPQPPTNTNVLASQIAASAAAVAAAAPAAAPAPVIVIEPAPPAPAPVAIPEPPAPTSYTPPAQVNPAEPTAPNPIDFALPAQVQPAMVMPQNTAVSVDTLPAIAAVSTDTTIPGGQSGDAALLKIAIGLLLI